MPLNHRVKKTLQRCKAQNLAPDIAADWDDLYELHKLAQAVDNPLGAVSNSAVLDVPVVVHNVKLHQLSIGAFEWLSSGPFMWWRSKVKKSDVALAYALAHSREPGALCDMVDPRKSWKTIKGWLRLCGATYGELMAGCSQVLRSQEKSESKAEDERHNDYAATLAALMREYGGKADYWKWEVGSDTIAGLLKEYNMKMSLERRAELAKNGTRLPPEKDDYGVKEMVAFQNARAMYYAKLQEREAE